MNKEEMEFKLEDLRKKRLELCAKVSPINTEIYLIECEMYALELDILEENIKLMND